MKPARSGERAGCGRQALAQDHSEFFQLILVNRLFLNHFAYSVLSAHSGISITAGFACIESLPHL